jgi:two-component system cell cycle response regulator
MDKVFKIGIFGLAANEQNTLASIFKLAASNSRKYQIVNSTEMDQSDIALVDHDDANAISEWHNFSVDHSQIPVVFVTKTTPEAADSTEVYLRRPLTLKRVLETLDQVVIDVYQYIPGVVIDDEEIIEETNTTFSSAAKNHKQNLGVKALVVDDSLAVRKSMDLLLGQYGIEIEFAETGEEALEYIQDNLCDIIFLDLILPGIDGYKVCKDIKSNKDSKHIPIIMLTGKGSYFDKIKGTMAGASVYLTKPVEQEQLKDVINEYLPNLN